MKQFLAVLAACLLITGNCFPADRIQDKLRLIQLKNGMKVFVYPRSATPMFAGLIIVNAGSAEEQAGETGLAHLLEHMAFKGTPWIGTENWDKEKDILLKIEEVGSTLTHEQQKKSPDQKLIAELTRKLSDLQKQESEYIIPNEYDQMITRAGGQEVNATTDNDFTNYFMVLPSNKLELWAMLESQRLMYPAWREFYLEREVVAEERRMRTDDSPFGKLYEDFMATAFEAHSYHHPVVGWMSDIFNLTITRVNDFYKRWYVPENFVAVLAGDVDVDQVRPIMEKYFGSMPAKTSPQKSITVEPPQQGLKRIQVKFPAQPQVLLGWHKPTFPDRDMYVFEVLQYLMTRTGRSSRLYERLVKHDSICQNVESFTAPGDKYPNMFAIWLTPRSPHTNEEAEKAALEEIDRIKREPVPEQELEKIRNQIDADFIKELESNMGLAKRLASYYLSSGDPNILDTMRDEMKKVTSQDIMRVAQKYLVPENETIAELVSATAVGSPQRPGVISTKASTSGTTGTEAKQ
jgi:predicted Zn-dependent peptidase